MDRKEFCSRMAERVGRWQKSFWLERPAGKITGSFPIPIEYIERYFAKGTNCIWDIGCGDGGKTLALRRAGFNIFGTDINESGFEENQAQSLREFGRPIFFGLDASVDTSDVDLKYDPFLDGALLQAVLTDLLPFGARNAARNIAAWLKPGGVVVASDFIRNDQVYSLLPDCEREAWAIRYQRDAQVTFDEGTFLVLKDKVKDALTAYSGRDFIDEWDLLASEWDRLIDHFSKHWTLDELRELFPGLALADYQTVAARTKRRRVTGVIAVWKKP